MKKLNNKIIGFIEKYPFFTDPIILFKTNNILSKKFFSSGKLEVEYPEIQKISKNIENIKIELKNIRNILEKTEFSDLNYKSEYINRINDFSDIIKIIEIFYNQNEQEKFELINKYFGVNIKQIGEILENKNYLLNYFKTEKPVLNQNKIEEYKKTELNSEEIKKYFTEALKYLNLEKNWKVKIGNTTSIIHTNFNELGGEIIIPKDKKINIKKLHYKYINNKISLEKLLKNYTGSIFRLFRGFKNIKKYSNLKDMVYLQGIYQIIKNLEKYGNFLDLIKTGVINQEYIEKYGVISKIREKFNLEKTSAIYILNKYFNI